MTGNKKIVGLWRESATNNDQSSQTAGSEGAHKPAPETEVATPSPVEAPTRGWLDRTALIEDEEPEAAAPSSTWYIHAASMLLILLGAGWIIFAGAVATERFSRSPSLSEWPDLISTIAIPLTLLAILWMALLRSGRSEQARFARVATALRDENAALNQSMHALGLQLSDAQLRLTEQAKIVQQLGVDTVAQLTVSSEKLAANASVIANANDQLARSGDIAMQRMDGLLAGLPRIDDVAQRLAGNFRDAGLAAHQQGASLEAQLAALSEEASKSARIGDAAASTLQNAIGAIETRTKQVEAELLATSTQVTDAHAVTLAQMTNTAASVQTDLGTAIEAIELRLGETWQQFREGVAAAADQLDDRLAVARSASDEIGKRLEGHGSASEELSARITKHVAEIGGQLEFLDVSVSASAGVIGRAIDDTKAQLTAFISQTQQGHITTNELISRAESLLLALDAVTRELDESLPRALERMASHGRMTQSTLSDLRPILEASELVAQSTLSHVSATQAKLSANANQMDEQAEQQQSLASQITSTFAEADEALAKLRAGTEEFAAQGGAKIVAMLDEAQETAKLAANLARQALDQLISDARDAMRATATDAIDEAFKTEIVAQLDAIGTASERAVAAANDATDRLMRQLITIMETSANAEARAAEAEQAIAATDKDSLAKQVGLLTESLKSTAIDVTKILSSDVSDAAWEAYLKGDRGVFARRAVKLVENSEAKEILRIYQNDDSFHAGVNQFIHDFEAMLRLLMNARDGSGISVTLLSSDIGKLYVALAQSIDRLRH